MAGSQFLEGVCWEDGHDLGRGGKFDGIGVKDEKFAYYGRSLKNLIFKVSSRKTNIYRGIGGGGGAWQKRGGGVFGGGGWYPNANYESAMAACCNA